MVFIIPREWWGARPPKSTPFKIKTPTPELWLHHAAGAMLPGDDQVSPIDYQRIRAIQNFHMDVRGWNDIAYSWLVDTDGYVFEGRGPGIAGAHTNGHNSISHAICVMGNYDTQPVDSDLVPRIAELVKHTHGRGWTPKVFSGGHRDVGATSCPGKNLYPLIPEINRLVTEEDDMPLSDEDIQKIAGAAATAIWAAKFGNPEPDGTQSTAALKFDRTYRGTKNVVARTSAEVAVAVWEYPIWDTVEGVDAAEALSRINRNVRSIVLNPNGLDEAELASLILAGLPTEAIADAIEAGPLVDAVRDELNRRLED